MLLQSKGNCCHPGKITDYLSYQLKREADKSRLFSKESMESYIVALLNKELKKTINEVRQQVIVRAAKKWAE